MVEDTKMTDSSKEDADKTTTTTSKTEEETPPKEPPLPPLQAAARRLDKSLSPESVQHYSNPTKVVRRWLGTSSGAAGAATLQEVSEAAAVLLDPAGPCAAGRTLLVTPEAEAAAASSSSSTSMEVEGEENKEEKGAPSPGYLSLSSAREVEAWLLSLSVRLLWKEQHYSDAYDRVQRSIHIVLDQHLAENGTTKSSLFPLLARLYRYRALVAEASGLKDHHPEITASLRKDMSLAHNLACLRRDVDSQATLLNLMLHDLLEHAQSK